MNLLQITVEPHVAIYLRHHFGRRIHLSDNNIVTLVLKPLLEPFDKTDPSRVKRQRKEELGDMIEVYISDLMIRKYGAYLSNEAIRNFNESVDLFVKQEMWRWCHHPNAHHKEVDYNIRRFIDFYGFAEDDLTFDNLKRWYYRERERIRLRKQKEDPAVDLIIPAVLRHDIEAIQVVQLGLF